MSGITLKDFQPINRWKLDSEGPQWGYGVQEPQYIIDQSTGRRYFNESKGIVGYKCFLLTLGTPFVHLPAAFINLAYRIAKVVSGSHFWAAASHTTTFKARLTEAGKDLLRIVAAPLALVGLELAAIYGMGRPYDGRKLYATIERAQYGNFILAPCFQPDPTQHALGGDVNKKNAF